MKEIQKGSQTSKFDCMRINDQMINVIINLHVDGSIPELFYTVKTVTLSLQISLADIFVLCHGPPIQFPHIQLLEYTSMLYCYEEQVSDAPTAIRPWFCVSGHLDGSSYTPPPLFPGRGADSAAYCADQVGCP